MTAEALLSPSALLKNSEEGESGDRSMIKAVINECVKLGLVLGEEGILSLNPKLPESVRRLDSLGSALPPAILDLVLTPGSESDDLAEALAWYLGQDVLTAPGTWKEFGEALQAQGATDVLRFNDNTFQMFAYWSRYLGFGNALVARSATGTEEVRLAPDPTDCLRRILEEILERRKKPLQMPRCLELVSARCPVFEGGGLRKVLDPHSPRREPKHLSSATSHALLRLEEDGTIAIHMRSDADAVILVDGSKRRSISEISWRHDVREVV